MYEISYGAKYEQTKDLDRVGVAKLIRADIKAAVASGELPHAKYSVRCTRGRGIYVSISDLPFPVLSRDYFELRADAASVPADKHWSWRVNAKDRPARERHTAEARAVAEAVRAIVDAYNYDGSDLQTDYFNVRFFSSVDLAEDGDALVAYLTGQAMEPELADLLPANDTALAPARAPYKPVGLVAAVGWED